MEAFFESVIGSVSAESDMPRLGVPKPGLRVPEPRLGVPKPRLEVPKTALVRSDPHYSAVARTTLH